MVMWRSTQQAPSADRADTGWNTGLVPGVANGDAITLRHDRDRAEIQLIVVGWVSAGGVHQNQVVFAQNLDSVIDLGVGAHSGRKNDGLAGLASVPQQVVVSERG